MHPAVIESTALGAGVVRCPLLQILGSISTESDTNDAYAYLQNASVIQYDAY